MGIAVEVEVELVLIGEGNMREAVSDSAGVGVGETLLSMELSFFILCWRSKGSWGRLKRM